MNTTLQPIQHKDVYTREVEREVNAWFREAIFAPIQIVLNDARAGSSDAEALKTKNGMIIDALTGLGSLPKDQFATGIVNTTHDLFVKGLFDAPHVQMMQQLAMLAGTDPEAARAQQTCAALREEASDLQKETQVAHAPCQVCLARLPRCAWCAG